MIYHLGLVREIGTDWSGVGSNDMQPVYHANRYLCRDRGYRDLSFGEWRGNPSTNVVQFIRWMDPTNDEPAEKIISDFKAAYRRAREEGIHPVCYPDVVRYFENRAADGHRIFVLSSHIEAELIDEVTEYGLAPLVSEIIGNVTDKAAMLKKVRGDRDGRTLLYQGDMDNDIRAAKAAGVMAVGLTRGYHSRSILEPFDPHLLVDSLAELDEHFVRSRIAA